MPDQKRFISFEGLDFSGKTTQINILLEKLRKSGYDVKFIREPGGTEISEKIRQILLDKKNMQMTPLCEVLLYSAARHQLIHEKIVPALTAGNFVVTDRYLDSTTAYQGYGRQMPLAFINTLNNTVVENVNPALTIYLDITLATLRKRKSSYHEETDRLEEQDDAFYQRVRKGYLKIAELDKKRIKIIDGVKSIEEIKSQIWELVITTFSL